VPSRFEERLAEIRAAAASPGSLAAREVLLRALRGRQGYLVSIAAAAVDPTVSAVAEALADAFDRLLEDPVKRDPNCHGKCAIVSALYDANVDVPRVFLPGSRHVQLEPIWGGTQDTAAALRGTCVMALMYGQHPRAMVEAARLLADPQTAARVAAARALGASGNREVAEPLLRLRVLTGEREPEPLGEYFGALLELAPEDSIEFLTPLLDGEDLDQAEAAALALGASRLPAVLPILCQRAEAFTGAGRRALLIAIALIRSEAAWAYLVDLVEDAPTPTARLAIEALATFKYEGALRQQVFQAAGRRGESDVRDFATASFDSSSED